MQYRAAFPATGFGLAALLILPLASCFKENEKRLPDAPKEAKVADAGGAQDVVGVARRRGLTGDELLAASRTFVPTGARDTLTGLMGTGTSGRVAVFGIPSMRILKYVGVFTPEAWQGYAYDDESTEVMEASAREDVRYHFGDLGLPALSLKGGKHDPRTAFLVDAANARVAVLDLEDYETKQIVVNPVFRGSAAALAVTPDTDYVVQVTAAPEIPGGAYVAPDAAELARQLRGGVTLWRVAGGGEGGGHPHIQADQSFTVELPPHLQGAFVAGKGTTADYVFVIGRCRGAGFALDAGSPCGRGEAPSVLHVVNWRKAASERASAALAVNGHGVIPIAKAVAAGMLRQYELPAGAEALALSSDGGRLAVGSRGKGQILLLDAQRLVAADAGGASPDEFGVPTLAAAAAAPMAVEAGGSVTGVAFGAGPTLYATATDPGRLLRIDASGGKVTAKADLDHAPAGLLVPGSETVEPIAGYVVVFNKAPHGRTVAVGPITGLNPRLYDTRGDALVPLYDMTVPQANALSAMAFDPSAQKTVHRYKSGTNSRTGEMSPVRTIAGQERIIRDGNRVHVFATLVRSHITPELVEVNQGDVVSFHITNLEQAQDQTHGFTIDTYNVHGSWEPGKTASVTFVASRPGVFSYYCTEFCSALHLEMEGYLLVKPKGWQPSADDMAEATVADPEADKRAYEAKMGDIKATQATIDGVVVWLKEHDYAKDERAAALVGDALGQLEQTKPIQQKIDAAVKDGNWQSARLWAEQYFQYQVKAADAGLRAKKILSEAGGGK